MSATRVNCFVAIGHLLVSILQRNTCDTLPPGVEVPDIRVVNNLDWFKGISFLSFLRDVGKFARVGTMLAKDSVRHCWPQHVHQSIRGPHTEVIVLGPTTIMQDVAMGKAFNSFCSKLHLPKPFLSLWPLTSRSRHVLSQIKASASLSSHTSFCRQGSLASNHSL